MFRGLILFYMAFCAIGYYKHEVFATGEHWTIFMIGLVGFTLATVLEEILKEVKKLKGE